MYAVIKSGGHQYRVKEGETIAIDQVTGDIGSSVTFDKVLLLSGDKLTAGEPFVKGASVSATVKQQKRGEKLVIFKYRRRKNYKKTGGHRQPTTVVEINKINA